MLVLNTERLCVTALTGSALQAWVEGDAERLRAETGALFSAPLTCPPLFSEDLSRFRDRMEERPHELGWWAWLVSRRADGRAVGVCGLGGRPDAEGTVELGYAVYPDEEGRGYATEASRAVMGWALARPGVARVRATVPSSNGPSASVARKLGLVAVARRDDAVMGEVTVYETPPGDASAEAPGWPERVHAVFREAGVALVAYVPAAGHTRLVELCRTDSELCAVRLASEEEAVRVVAGARLRGERAVLLVHSSGVRNLVAALEMARAYTFPLVLLVTMRGVDEETGSPQTPRASAAGALLLDKGVHVVRADVSDAVPLAVAAALERARAAESTEAVLIAQRLIGAKRGEEAR